VSDDSVQPLTSALLKLHYHLLLSDRQNGSQTYIHTPNIDLDYFTLPGGREQLYYIVESLTRILAYVGYFCIYIGLRKLLRVLQTITNIFEPLGQIPHNSKGMYVSHSEIRSCHRGREQLPTKLKMAPTTIST